MEPERWTQIEKLCYDALMQAPADQKAFLDETCGNDDDLRRQVESLLSADARAGHFITSPLAARPAARSPEDLEDATHHKLGNYELLRKIGEGGTSTVYLARRIDRQFHKEVAIKLLRRAMAAKTEYLRRFHIERQILADLEHPFIARLLDGGATEDGSPYVVMELVEGEPIDLYCDQAGLSVKQRLELFRKICIAVQHAHRNMVVHRDLKPSNILVTRQGKPKLLDFGIAKMLEPDPYDPQFEPTATGQRLMTPQYASPEQIRGEKITTASDVYSLGVVLHLLLSGYLPYRLQGFSPEAMADELDAWSMSKMSLTRHEIKAERDPIDISRTRGVGPEQLRRQLRGDLDNIVSKALAGDPERRYRSVEQLEEDLRRHLVGLPVLACESTWAYRLGKLARRHRFKLAAAVGFLIIFTIFLATLILQVHRTSQERDKAEATLTFLRDVFLVADPSKAEGEGAQTTFGAALDRASRLLDNLEPQPEVQASLQYTLGSIYSNLGLYLKSEALLRQALAHHRTLGTSTEIIDTLNDLALVLLHQHRNDEAERLYFEALEWNQRQPARNPAALGDTFEGLGIVASQREDLPTAERWYREALRVRQRDLGPDHAKVADSLDSLGTILEATADYDAAEALLRQASNIYRARFGEGHPHFAINLGNLGMLLYEKGDTEEAESMLRQAHRLKKEGLGYDHPSTLNTLNSLAVVLRNTGQAEAAVELQREVLSGYRSRFDEFHPTVARSYHNLAAALRKAHRYEEAESVSREAIRRARVGLEKDHPNLAFLLTELAENLLEQNEAEAAEPLLREALTLRQQGLPAGHWLTAESQSQLGLCLARLERFEEARPLLAAGWRGVRSVQGDDHDRTRAAYERFQALPKILQNR